MTEYVLRGVEEGDLLYLSQNLRGADMTELVSTYGPRVNPVEALEMSVSNSDQVVVTVGASGNPMFIHGIATWTNRSRLIWACGTPEIASREYATRFIRKSRAQIAQWFAENPEVQYLTNRAHASNRLHLKWLQWCQAEILPALPYGPLGQDFNQFIIRRDSYV
jgi:hypothetical protein